MNDFPSFGSFPADALKKPTPMIEDKDKTKPIKHRKSKSKREPKLEPEFLSEEYYYDLKGDGNNVKYQAIRNEPVPIFKRWSYVILGIRDWKISTSSQKDSHLIIYPVGGGSQERLDYKEFKYAVKNKRIVMRPTETVETDDSDYIPLPSDESLEEEGLDPEDFSKETAFQERCIVADRLVHKEPNNIGAWIDFINLQDSLHLYAVNQSKQSINRRIIDKKHAILEKAIENNPNSDELAGLYMELNEENLTSKELLSKWDQVLAQFPNSFALWKRYIDYRMRNPAAYNFNAILELFEESLESIARLPNGIFSSNTGETRDGYLLHLFDRLSRMLRESGYIERSIACYQALIEFNLFVPNDHKRKGFYNRVDLFEEFWESEVPRFGDKDAKGWAAFVADGSSAVIGTDDKVELSEFEEVIDEYERWYCKEIDNQKHQWLPVRGSEDEDVEDPFQTVLFDDIRGFLVDIGSANKRQELIGHFITFLGIPIGFTCKSSSLYYQDQFLHNQFINLEMRRTFLHGSQDTAMFCPTYFNPSTISSLYWPSNFTRRDIQALEAPHKGAEKLAKKLLKSEPMNLYLWNTFGRMILAKQGEEEAVKIYATTVELAIKFPPHHQVGIEAIYSSYAEIEWKRGNVEKAIAILVAAATKSKIIDSPSQPMMLKAKKAFQANLEDQSPHVMVNCDLYSSEMDTFLESLYNFALLQVLTTGIETGIDTIKPFLEKVKNNSLLHELIYVYTARLVSLGAQNMPLFKPEYLRVVLENALASFPNNTLFLSLYGWNEGRTKIDNRVRRFVNEHLTSNPSHILYNFAIWTELHQRSSPNRQIIIGLLVQAMKSKSSMYSIQVWLLAITDALKQNELDRAKSIFYQAIGNCPWSKDLYLMAFGPAREAFSEDEIKDIIELIEEKEIRLSNSLDFFKETP